MLAAVRRVLGIIPKAAAPGTKKARILLAKFTQILIGKTSISCGGLHFSEHAHFEDMLR